jgi:hypothetical protein
MVEQLTLNLIHQRRETLRPVDAAGGVGRDGREPDEVSLGAHEGDNR